MDKAFPGQSFDTTAKTHNEIADVVNNFRNKDSVFGLAGTTPAQRNYVLVKNTDATEDIPRFGFMTVSDVLIDPTDNEDEYLNKHPLEGVLPNISVGENITVVALEPIAPGELGRCAFSGVFPVKLKLTSDYNRYAQVIQDDPEALQGANEGPYKIVWQEAGVVTGATTKEALVAFGNAPSNGKLMKNVSGIEMPGGSASVYSSNETATGAITVTRATADDVDASLVFINPIHVAIPDDGYFFLDDNYGEAAVVPVGSSVGDEIGVKANTWSLQAGQTGFKLAAKYPSPGGGGHVRPFRSATPVEGNIFWRQTSVSTSYNLAGSGTIIGAWKNISVVGDVNLSSLGPTVTGAIAATAGSGMPFFCIANPSFTVSGGTGVLEFNMDVQDTNGTIYSTVFTKEILRIVVEMVSSPFDGGVDSELFAYYEGIDTTYPLRLMRWNLVYVNCTGVVTAGLRGRVTGNDRVFIPMTFV